MKKIITFGEIMMRVAPEGLLRFRQSMPGTVETTFSGAEANVAASVVNLGGKAAFVSALPEHAIADACISTLKGLSVDTNFIQRTDKGRLGVYFLETGANQRPSNVIYDREYSSVSLMTSDDYPMDEIFSDAGWLHISGITPALSKQAAEASIAFVKHASENGVKVSCDLNFRKKLWKWDSSKSPTDLAQETMRKLLPYVDVVIGNEEDAWDVLGISAGTTDVHSGSLEIENYPRVATQIIEQFPNVSKVAITLRESISASHNNWGAMLYDAETESSDFAPMQNAKYQPYEIHNIVDRVGGGDSFAAGLIFALNTPELAENKSAISFAVAASCLAHSVTGDFNFNTRSEVERLMNGNASGRVVR